MNQAEALALALTEHGYVTAVEGDRVSVEAPKGCTAEVVTSGECRCSFTIVGDFRVAAANWTKALRDAVSEAWPACEKFEAAEPVAVIVVEPAQLEPALEHTYPIGPCVDASFAVSYDDARRGRFRVVSTWASRCDGGFEIDAPWSYAGPSIHWHAWGAVTANLRGVGKAWANIAGVASIVGHPAESPVSQLLQLAAESEPLPSGIVALDFRGLSASLVHALVTALVTRVRASSEPRKGVIILCEDRASAYVSRTIELDVSV